jgi:hypothetical protein
MYECIHACDDSANRQGNVCPSSLFQHRPVRHATLAAKQPQAHAQIAFDLLVLSTDICPSEDFDMCLQVHTQALQLKVGRGSLQERAIYDAACNHADVWNG